MISPAILKGNCTDALQDNSIGADSQGLKTVLTVISPWPSPQDALYHRNGDGRNSNQGAAILRAHEEKHVTALRL
jgi:hypothetical protein